uniref:Uncharacterized protein n=1 Tax=Arundo donax TaxID=35708 RepID=A0A0A9BMN9_ARUDO
MPCKHYTVTSRVHLISRLSHLNAI